MNNQSKIMNQQPVKPYPTFPLTPHQRGWCKKIGGRVRIICGHVSATEALRIFHLKAPRLYGYATGQPGTPAHQQPAVGVAAPLITPTSSVVAVPACPATPGTPLSDVAGSNVITIDKLKEEFLAHKRSQIDAGELTERTYCDYQEILNKFARVVSGRVCDLVPAVFADYRKQLAMTLGPHALSRHIQNIRAMFAWAYESERIPSAVRYGGGFDKPSATVKRKAKAKHDMEHGKAMLTPAEIKMLLAEADKPMRAMVLLGLNGGLGNNDIASLPIAALDLDNGWLDFPRPKTGIERRIPLWPETVAAIRHALDVRPKPKNADDRCLVFLSPEGLPLVRVQSTVKAGKVRFVAVNTLSLLFSHLLTKTGLRKKDARREGLNFYALRRTFRTIADEVSRDQHAIHRIMGHTVTGMAGIYVQRITDDRLKAVTDAVRSHLSSAITMPLSGNETKLKTASEIFAENLNELLELKSPS